MTKKTDWQSWTRKSERAIPYGLLARVSDWWSASRDGRKGIPEVPADGRRSDDTVTGTPHMMFLGQHGLGRIQKEWVVYQANVGDRMAELSNQRAGLQALREQLESAENQAQAAEADAGPRGAVAGEENTDEAIIQQRRVREQSRRREQAQTAVRQLTERINAVEAQVALVEEQIRVRLRIAQRRSGMIEAHVRRRRAAYLTRLLRKHPQGRELNALLRPEWPSALEWTAPASELIAETNTVLSSKEA